LIEDCLWVAAVVAAAAAIARSGVFRWGRSGRKEADGAGAAPGVGGDATAETNGRES
jgi:hypothetical protein